MTTPPPVASAAPAGRPGVAWPGPRPVGVVAALVGWDCPLLGLAWAVAPALACGDTVVLRPAATSPLTALRFAEICRQVDLPAGVVNVVTGDEPTARRLVEHPGVDLVTCGGPRDLGRSVARWVAGAGKRLSLDLGGTAANLVFDDAPVDETVEGIVNAVFFNRGHVGHTGTRLLVQESIAEDLLAALRERMARLRVGDPLDGNTDVGAVHTPVHLAKLRDLVEAAAADGGQRWSAPAELPQQGFWFAPTILTGVSQANLMAREEVYGPVLSVRTFRTADEAVALANNIPSGPATGIWTAKTSRMLAVAERLHSGVVWANTFNRLDPTAPYGGYQESGYGRAGGRHGLEAYLA